MKYNAANQLREAAIFILKNNFQGNKILLTRKQNDNKMILLPRK